MRRNLILIAALAAATAAVIGAAPAVAEPRVTCRAPSWGTDANLQRATSTVYQLPGGQKVTVSRQTDALTASYAVERGTLVQVCVVR